MSRALVTLVLVAVVLLSIPARISCGEQWKESGMRSRYGLWTGCMVEARPGQWLPAENLREFPAPEVVGK